MLDSAQVMFKIFWDDMCSCANAHSALLTVCWDCRPGSWLPSWLQTEWMRAEEFSFMSVESTANVLTCFDRKMYLTAVNQHEINRINSSLHMECSPLRNRPGDDCELSVVWGGWFHFACVQEKEPIPTTIQSVLTHPSSCNAFLDSLLHYVLLLFG